MQAARNRAAGLAPLPIALGLWFGFCASAFAADFPEFIEGSPGPSAPRYFPRGGSDGDPSVLIPPSARRRMTACAPWRAPVPTDAPDDPSYVGSEYGLGKPSYYGFRPGLGRDDPFGRPLRYCP